MDDYFRIPQSFLIVGVTDGLKHAYKKSRGISEFTPDGGFFLKKKEPTKTREQHKYLLWVRGQSVGTGYEEEDSERSIAIHPVNITTAKQ